jgi:Na+(H+)/acetate symporter ActP
MPLRNPSIFSLPLSLFVAITVSLLKSSPAEQRGFSEMHTVLEN